MGDENNDGSKDRKSTGSTNQGQQQSRPRFSENGPGLKYSDDPATAQRQKEIEKRLLDSKNKNAEEKKKLMRELQLEYHPDKNDDPLAKTVFQFVQGAKPWYMQDQ